MLGKVGEVREVGRWPNHAGSVRLCQILMRLCLPLVLDNTVEFIRIHIK